MAYTIFWSMCADRTTSALLLQDFEANNDLRVTANTYPANGPATGAMYLYNGSADKYVRGGTVFTEMWCYSRISVGNSGTQFYIHRGATLHFTLGINGSGSVYVTRAYGGSTLVQTPNNTVSLNQWTPIHWRVVNTSYGQGSVEVWVNGVKVIDAANVNLNHNDGVVGWDKVGCGGVMDDGPVFYVSDAGPLNDGRGLKVIELPPEAAGVSQDFAAVGAATPLACVDETTYDNSKYITGTVLGQKASFRLAAAPAGITGTVLAVQAVATVATDAGNRDYRVNLRSGSNVLNGSTNMADSTVYSARKSPVFHSAPGGGEITLAQLSTLEVEVEIMS